MNKYELKHKVIFDEETHTYWASQEDFNAMNEKFNEYKGNMDKREYFVSQGYRYKKLTSTTQLLSKIYPFGLSLDAIRGWLVKIDNKCIGEEKALDMVANIDTIKEILKRDTERAQVDGTEAHLQIQEFIEEFVKENYDKAPTNEMFDNIYSAEFALEFSRGTKLTKLICGIKELLPCEIPVAYWSEEENKYLYSGMWDGLYKMKDGRHILIDIKTGSKVAYDKKEKVMHQMNAYDNLIRNNLGIEVDEHICIGIYNEWNKKTKEFEVKVELISFEPKPKSFFELLKKSDELERLKKGDKNE